MTPLSTVCKSFTLKDGKSNCFINLPGNRCVHVSSPMKTIRRLFFTNWSMKLSSVISALSKFELTSTNVGKLPVVKPLSLCIVVVGGSAQKWYRRVFWGFLSNNSCSVFNLFWYGNSAVLSIDELYATKSNRRASITMMTALSYRRVIQQPSPSHRPSGTETPARLWSGRSSHVLFCATTDRFNRKPLKNNDVPTA